MPKDIITGTEQAYPANDKQQLHRVQVSSPRESEKSIGALVDLILNDDGICTAAGRLEWFPKSLCTIEEVDQNYYYPAYFITAPAWLLDKNKVKYEKK